MAFLAGRPGRAVLPAPLIRLVRLLSLVLLAALGTVLLMRGAPGYFADERAGDPRFTAVARAAEAGQRAREGSLLHHSGLLLRQWAHGDLGRSRQYDVPVRALLASRLLVTARLIGLSVASGWLLALALALPLAARRTHAGELLIAAPTAVLLAVPTGALALLCLLLDRGGPVFVLTTVVAVRDFKLVYRLLRESWAAPCMLHARAGGLSAWQLAIAHLLPRLLPPLLALATMSFVLALSAAVPVEVVFNVPGAGQLAWAAAMNRDLPVLLAVTLVLALAVGLAGLAGDLLGTQAGQAANPQDEPLLKRRASKPAVQTAIQESTA